MNSVWNTNVNPRNTASPPLLEPHLLFICCLCLLPNLTRWRVVKETIWSARTFRFKTWMALHQAKSMANVTLWFLGPSGYKCVTRPPSNKQYFSSLGRTLVRKHILQRSSHLCCSLDLSFRRRRHALLFLHSWLMNRENNMKFTTRECVL